MNFFINILLIHPMMKSKLKVIHDGCQKYWHFPSVIMGLIFLLLLYYLWWQNFKNENIDFN